MNYETDDETRDYETKNCDPPNDSTQNNTLSYSTLRKHVKRSRVLTVGILIGATLTYLLNPFPMMVEVNWERERRHIKFDNRDKYWCPLPNLDHRKTEEREIVSR